MHWLSMPPISGHSFTLYFLCFVSSWVEAAELDCPDGGTEVERFVSDDNQYVRFCKSADGVGHGPVIWTRASDGSLALEETMVNGLRHGPARNFDEGGVLQSEGLYENGELVYIRLTLDGLRQIAAEKNAKAKAGGKRWRLSVPDLYTLEYEVTLGAPWSWRWFWTLFGSDDNGIEQKHLESEKVCDVFELDAAEINRVVTRYVDRDGLIIREATLNKSDCNIGNMMTL